MLQKDVQSLQLLTDAVRSLKGIVDAPLPRTADQWADAHRILPQGVAEAGPWRSSRTPYMTEPVRAFKNPNYRRIVWVMGSQMGKTANQFNVIGHRLDDDPAPVLYLGPTQSNIRTMIEPKIMDMIHCTPSLERKYIKSKSTKTLKVINGIPFRMAWAGSAAELASDSAAIGIVDEVDRMASSVKGEGDPVELMEARTSTFPDGKVGVASTPTVGTVESIYDERSNLWRWNVSEVVESPIWRLWQEGTRHEWAWPCPHCEEYFIPRMDCLKWPEDSTPESAGRHAKMGCPHCDELIDSKYKDRMNRHGVFVAPAQKINKKGEVTGKADTDGNDIASFWISGLCTFSSKKTFGYFARRYLNAIRTREPDKIQAVINTELGELYSVLGEAPKWDIVYNKRKPYEQGAVVEGVKILTAGVDVQKDRLVYVVRGWGLHMESWLVTHGELWGETRHPSVWKQLHELLEHTYGDDSRVRMMAIDSGYETNSVYSFCNRNKGLTIPTKGHDKLDKPFYASRVEVNIKGETHKQGMQLWHFDSDVVKTWVHAQVDWPDDEVGGWWLPHDITEDYCKQIVSEGRVKKSSGKVVWIRHQKDNHFLDAEGLAYLSIRILNPNFDKIEAPVQVRRKRRIISKGMTTWRG